MTSLFKKKKSGSDSPSTPVDIPAPTTSTGTTVPSTDTSTSSTAGTSGQAAFANAISPTGLIRKANTKKKTLLGASL